MGTRQRGVSVALSSGYAAARGAVASSSSARQCGVSVALSSGCAVRLRQCGVQLRQAAVRGAVASVRCAVASSSGARQRSAFVLPVRSESIRANRN